MLIQRYRMNKYVWEFVYNFFDFKNRDKLQVYRFQVSVERMF